MRLNQLVIALLLGAMLSACRIEIKTPTSGAVSTTSGNINCAAGQLCDIDLVDIYFDEEFVARPASGFVFEEQTAEIDTGGNHAGVRGSRLV